MAPHRAQVHRCCLCCVHFPIRQMTQLTIKKLSQLGIRLCLPLLTHIIAFVSNFATSWPVLRFSKLMRTKCRHLSSWIPQATYNSIMSRVYGILNFAGLLLKNSLVRPPIYQGHGCRMKFTPAACEQIKHLIMKCIIEENNQGVRNAASSCVAVCSVPLANVALSHAAFPLEEWPQLIPF